MRKQDKYINKFRIRWWVSAFVQVLLFAAVFLPTVTLVGTQSSAFSIDKVSQSAYWYFAGAGYPEIYDVILIVYIVLSLPLLVYGFIKGLKRFPVMLAAVATLICFGLNILLTVFIYNLGVTGNFSASTTFTAWFWIYLAVGVAQIVHLFMLFGNMKKK